MTPSEIEQMAREAYNAIGDKFWSQAEIVNLIYKGCVDLFNETLFVIEKTYEADTVVGQKEYLKPSTLYSVKKMFYDKTRVMPAGVNEDDTESVTQGRPVRYTDWNGRFILHPIPDEVKTLKIYGYHYPSPLAVNSSLEVPEYMHVALVDFVLSRMCGKEKELNALMAYYDRAWKDAKLQFADLLLLKKSGDAYSRVQNEDEIGQYFSGRIL